MSKRKSVEELLRDASGFLKKTTELVRQTGGVIGKMTVQVSVFSDGIEEQMRLFEGVRLAHRTEEVRTMMRRILRDRPPAPQTIH